MAMDDLDLLTNYDVPKDGKEGEDGRKCGLPVDDEERNVIDFKTIRKISDSSATLICMSDDYDFVPAINQFLRWLVYIPICWRL